MSTAKHMNPNRDPFSTSDREQRLIDVLLATIRYLPLLTALLALGLFCIFGLANTGLLGTPAWQMLAVAGACLLAGFAIFPIAVIARRGRAQLAFMAFCLILALWSLSLVLLWEAALAVAILIAWTGLLTGMLARYNRSKLLLVALVSAVFTAALYLLDGHPWLTRLSTANPAGVAALILLASTFILFALATIVVRLFRYRTLQSRIVVSFALILAVPILFTTAISAINAYSNSQAQFASSLQAISSLKQSQIESAVRTVALELSSVEQGSGKAASLVHVLNRAAESDESYRLNVSVASTALRNVIVENPASQYEEVLLLDSQGIVVLSTYSLDQGMNLGNEDFTRQGRSKFYAEMTKFPGKQNPAGEYKFVAAAPLYGDSGQDIRGVVVAVAKSNLIFSALGPAAGLPDTRSYLVGTDSQLITNSPAGAASVTAWPIVHLAIGKGGTTIDTFTNYQGVSVLGYGVWDPTINAVVLAEVPSSSVYSKALSTLLVSGLVGIFALIIAAIAAIATSRAISDPILRLAKSAEALAGGDLNSRSAIEQEDEVGKLANSFNSMADQLQGVIGNLEQRIAERTEALEQQTLRLRTAAEVARDAASAPSLDALLDQAARLIMDRFGFYHTGIFLVDEKHEYAVLRASPSEAGKIMLANGHRLRIGEQGIVGRVAATGEPRIALDTGVDPVYFSNPNLPNTHSEMALPLKTPEGTFGIIDIQSDQPEAFTQDDIAIVQVMADQLATAIQRTLLLQQVQTHLQQLEHTQQEFTQQTWHTFVQSGSPNIGYRFDNVRLEPIKLGDDAKAHVSATASGPAAGASNVQGLEVPIRLRGQTIGIVNLRFQAGQIPDVTAAVAQQIADRLATALENARLLEDSQRRANKERAIGEITSRISASVNMRNVLQTAVEELGRAIPGSDVLIQFRPDAEIQS